METRRQHPPPGYYSHRGITNIVPVAIAKIAGPALRSARLFCFCIQPAVALPYFQQTNLYSRRPRSVIQFDF